MPLAPSATILSTDQMGRVAAPITASVGVDAVNAPADVFVVQSLLNDRLPKPHARSMPPASPIRAPSWPSRCTRRCS